jgi:hypothetical protein
MLVGFRPVLCPMVTVGRGGGGWVVVVVVWRVAWFAPYALEVTAISTTVTTLIIPTKRIFMCPRLTVCQSEEFGPRLSASATCYDFWP